MKFKINIGVGGYDPSCIVFVLTCASGCTVSFCDAVVMSMSGSYCTAICMYQQPVFCYRTFNVCEWIVCASGWFESAVARLSLARAAVGACCSERECVASWFCYPVNFCCHFKILLSQMAFNPFQRCCEDSLNLAQATQPLDEVDTRYASKVPFTEKW